MVQLSKNYQKSVENIPLVTEPQPKLEYNELSEGEASSWMSLVSEQLVLVISLMISIANLSCKCFSMFQTKKND